MSPPNLALQYMIKSIPPRSNTRIFRATFISLKLWNKIETGCMSVDLWVWPRPNKLAMQYFNKAFTLSARIKLYDFISTTAISQYIQLKIFLSTPELCLHTTFPTNYWWCMLKHRFAPHKEDTNTCAYVCFRDTNWEKSLCMRYHGTVKTMFFCINIGFETALDSSIHSTNRPVKSRRPPQISRTCVLKGSSSYFLWTKALRNTSKVKASTQL